MLDVHFWRLVIWLVLLIFDIQYILISTLIKYIPATPEPNTTSQQNVASARAIRKRSLLDLPVEILLNIIPDPADYGITPDAHNPRLQRWLAIKRLVVETPCVRLYPRFANPDEALATLRALSQTCRALKKLTLPLLWGVVQLSSDAELLRLRQMLAASPEIAQHVRSFSYVSARSFRSAHKCLLDQRDQTRMYRWLLEAVVGSARAFWFVCGEVIEQELTRANHPISHVALRKIAVLKTLQLHDQTLFQAFQSTAVAYGDHHHLQTAQDFRANADLLRPVEYYQKFSCKGWHTQDAEYIMSDPEFEKRLVATLNQLSCLETFAWGHVKRQIPNKAVDILRRRKRLNSVQVVASQNWDANCLANLRLTTAKLRHFSFHYNFWNYDKDARKELSENAVQALARAAKGGSLRRISFATTTPSLLGPVFADPSFLPCWVAIEQWDCEEGYPDPQIDPRDIQREVHRLRWSAAAASLRTALAHASLCLETSRINGQRIDRLLTPLEVMSLKDHFKGLDEIPDFATDFREDQPIDLALAHLASDVALATDVSEAWNAVVRRGEADVVKCDCKYCEHSFAMCDF